MTENRTNYYISLQDAIDAVHENYDVILDFKSTGRTIADSIEDILCDLPSSDLDLDGYSERLWKVAYKRGKRDAEAERKKGKWIVDKGLYKCSSCNGLWVEWWAVAKPIEQMNKAMPYCPMCGAEMVR